MRITYKRPFAQFVKKSKKPLQLVIEDKVSEICYDPSIGIAKLGDLKGILVYKFRFTNQEYLIAYEYSESIKTCELLWVNFYQVGSHENFYAELKRFIRNDF
jgi:mRNA-degrading endonuclease RelE of RelBE toxin-antitoxin system